MPKTSDETDQLDKGLIELVDDALERSSWLLKENSNTRISPSLIDLYVTSQVKKTYALNRLYSKQVSQSHKDGYIHIHDLHNPFVPYCAGHDARIFLLDGLRFPDARSHPAKKFDTAVYHTMAYLFHSQQFFAGAQAIDVFNWLLAPHLYRDRLDYKQVKQILQGFIFQMNQSNRIGSQSAFTNLGLRVRCPPYLECEKAIWAGHRLKYTYADFENEARMIYQAIMEVLSEGDADGAPFTFPLVTTAITSDLDKNDPLWIATMKATSSKGAPYFLNLTTDYLKENFVQAMCCRLLVTHSGGVWSAGGMGTGSNKVITVNLPRIALESKDEPSFFELLEAKMEIARVGLIQSNKIIKRSLDEWQILPWLKMKTKDGQPYYDFEQRRLTFGIVGLNECLLNLIHEPITSDEGYKFGLMVIKYMHEQIKNYSEKDGVTYTFEQTPAESAAHRLAMIDRSKFPTANVQGTSDGAYYTNSTHVPYALDISLIDKVSIESEFHPYFTGGTMCHIWMGESHPDPTGLNEIVKKLSETKLAYFCFSPDFSVCENNHVSRGKKERCQTCGGIILTHISRVTGYFGRTTQWNPGKQEEYKSRHRYSL
ncbi:MAG: anaerobic ribonucleoside-triphosphate reductase [Methanocellales archaeon]|nr:anaerobic ribonucleoside-triphosphate reductase [Methanocellales archaeon]